MKQHISLSDLNQLSDKGKNAYWQYSKLNNWRKPDSDYDLWSIGQLIQFLDEHGVDWVNELYWVSRGDTPAPEIVSGYGDKELCDSLWMAVKDILEKET